MDLASSLDRLSPLLEHFRVRAHLFHAGVLRGDTHFDPQPGRAFLHVLRRGELAVTHAVDPGVPRSMTFRRPTLLFYPRAFGHTFHNAPRDGADFVCASLAFDGGDRHPIVRALPLLVTAPLAEIPELEQTLELLFAETERMRCGQRWLAGRLFEVLLMQLLRWWIDRPDTALGRPGIMAGLAHPRLAKALNAVHDRPGERWTLATMAQVAGMSRSAFAAEFHRSVGHTPAEYVLRWRVSIAQSMLRGGASVGRTSDALGYANAASFGRAFQLIVGRPPRTWRNDDASGTAPANP